MRGNHYLRIVSHIQLHTSKKDLFFNIRLTRKGLALIKLLEKLSVIRHYYNLGAGIYRIFPFYSRHYKSKRMIRLYTRNTNDLQVSLSPLHMMRSLSPTSHFLLETHKGLVTHKEALMRRTGGKLIAVIL